MRMRSGYNKIGYANELLIFFTFNHWYRDYFAHGECVRIEQNYNV